MPVKLVSTRIDTVREGEGEWFDLVRFATAEEEEVPRIKVRGFGYVPYQRAKNLVEIRWAREYRNKPVPPHVSYVENGKLYAEHILIDWEGFDEPYSRNYAKEILCDPGFRWLHEEIRNFGQELAETHTELVEETAKNSSPASDGSSEVA